MIRRTFPLRYFWKINPRINAIKTGSEALAYFQEKFMKEGPRKQEGEIWRGCEEC